MAAYEAIRDSFREFNRTLIDSQQWDAQHESRMADQQLKETMLMNQLNQQTFSNRMQKEQLRLSQSTNQQGADRLAANIANQDRRFAMDQSNIIADNKHQTAQLANQVKGTKNTAEYRDATLKAKAKLDKETIETANITQKNAELEHTKLVKEADLEAKATEPTLVTIPPKYQANPIVMDQLKDQVMMRYGGTITEDGVVIDKHGEELNIPFHEYRELKFQADAMMAANDNKQERVQNESGILTRDIASKKSSASTFTSTYDQAKKAAMNRQINVMEAELEKRNKYLASLDTVKGKAKYLMDHAAQLRVAAGNLSNPNKGNDSETAKGYIAQADAEEAQATAMRLAERNRLAAVAKGELPGDIDKTLVSRMDKMYKTAIAPSESMFDSLSGDIDHLDCFGFAIFL
jgi:hypothetical protein